MKRLKISPLITFVMATQMIVSPFAHANPLQAIQMAGQIMQASQQNVIAQRNAIANQQMVSQLTAPGRDKYFNTDSLARVPGLMEYMAQNGINPASLTCPTLPTTLTESRAEVCRIGVTNDRGAAPQAQLGEMFSMYKTYGDVAKTYENYRSTSNAEGQGFGVGCMKNALQTLSGFFAYRINELDKLTTNLEALNNQFREASKVDLNAIEESTAVLDGGSSELADEVRTRRPDLFDFGKRFDNPACKSMYAGDSLNTIANGRPGGLNQINKKMKDEFAGKTGKFSGESYIGAHASVIADINKMADSAAQQFKLNFTAISSDARGFGEFAAGVQGSVSSANGLNSLLKGDFFADAQLNYSKQFEKIASDKSTLESELSAAGVNPQSALRLANNLNANNFESEVGLLQNQIRNGCLQRSFGGAGFWDRIKKNIVDPDASKFANKNAFNAIRERIEDIMTNRGTTPEYKIDQLRKLEQSSGSRYMLKMQGSYQKTVLDNSGKAQTTNVNPSSNAPSSYFNDVVQTCDAQFSTNKLGSAMTGSGAIQKLRELNQQYRTLATAQENNIRSEIRRKLIECENSSEASNQVAGSCNRERFNTSQAGFCANAAFSCATNMKSCTTQSQNFINQIKTERTARVTNYKALVNKNKNDIVRIFDTALAKYMREGEMMRGLFGAGFSSPAGIERDVKGDKFLGKFREATQDSPDGALLLEDPDKYVEMFKKNIALLKNEVQKQQQEIMGNGGRGGLLALHVDQTDKNYQAAQRKAEEISNTCIAKHDDYVRQAEQQRQQQLAEQQKKMNELGEKRQEFCNRFSMLSTNPGAACNGNIMDVVSAGNAAGQRDLVQEFSRECAGVQAETRSTEQNGNPELLAQEYCRRFPSGTAGANPTAVEDRIKTYCAELNERGRPNCEAAASTSTASGGTQSGGPRNCNLQINYIIANGRPSGGTSNVAGAGSSQDRAPSADTAEMALRCMDNSDRNTPEGGSLMGANSLQAVGQIFGQ